MDKSQQHFEKCTGTRGAGLSVSVTPLDCEFPKIDLPTSGKDSGLNGQDTTGHEKT